MGYNAKTIFVFFLDVHFHPRCIMVRMGARTVLIELVDVSKRYDRPAGGQACDVLRGVCLSLAAGESLAVVGPSGSGKSTLLNLIGGLDRPTSGRVLLEGADLSSLSDFQLAAVRASRIGFVFQLHHLLPQCSALENVMVPAMALQDKPSADQTRQRAEELLVRVGLAQRMDYRPGELSGGECQRVAVVRALMNRPKLLLADEPTGSLDHTTAEALADLLVELNRQEGVGLIVVTHSDSVARRMGRVLELCDGRLHRRAGG
jgi:predicted ABC-type transport system involved in lysophospholipase L1 biosynthesis ATPase subunit